MYNKIATSLLAFVPAVLASPTEIEVTGGELYEMNQDGEAFDLFDGVGLVIQMKVDQADLYSEDLWQLEPIMCGPYTVTEVDAMCPNCIGCDWCLIGWELNVTEDAFAPNSEISYLQSSL